MYDIVMTSKSKKAKKRKARAEPSTTNAYAMGLGRTDKSCVGSIAAHPCKERKDGAPSVGIVRAEIVKGGPPALLFPVRRTAGSSLGRWPVRDGIRWVREGGARESAVRPTASGDIVGQWRTPGSSRASSEA